MPETIDPTAPVTSHETVVPTQVTTETLDANGKSIPVNSNLASIFDKIESGVDRKEAVKEVMGKGKPSAPAKKEEVATSSEKREPKEIKVVSSHPKEEDNKDADPAKELNEALSRGQEKKGQAADEDKVGKEEATSSQDEIPEEELQVLPHDKPKTAKRISALLQKVAKVTESEATTRKQIEERDAKLKELQDQLSKVKTVDPKTEEEIASTKKELSMFRRRYELDKDPEVKQRFDARIEQADAAIPEILKKHRAGDALLKLIEEEGGWVKFAKSGRPIQLADGSMPTASELADQIVSALPYDARATVNSLTMERISVEREKARFLEAELKAADEFFKKKEEEANKGTAEYQRQIKEAEEAIKKWQEKVAVENAFLKEKEIPSTATQEQKKEIEEDNKAAKEINEILNKNLNTKDLDGMLNIVLDATKFYHEKREKAKIASELAKVKAELKAKSDELDRFKLSGKTTTKSGSLTGGGSSAPSTKPEKPKTLEEAFEALASARSSSD